MTERGDERVRDLRIGVRAAAVRGRRATQQRTVGQAIVVVAARRREARLGGELLGLVRCELELGRARFWLRLAHDVGERLCRVEGRRCEDLVALSHLRRGRHLFRPCRDAPGGSRGATDDVTGAAEQRADRGAGQEQDARERGGGAEEHASRSAYEAADDGVESLADEPGAGSEDEEEAEHGDRAAGPERAHVEERRPGNEQRAGGDEHDRQHVRKRAEGGVEAVHDLLACDATVPAEVEERREEEPQREQPKTCELGPVMGVLAATPLRPTLDARRLARPERSLLLAARHGSHPSTRSRRPLRGGARRAKARRGLGRS
jgi:hypothetical protein